MASRNKLNPINNGYKFDDSKNLLPISSVKPTAPHNFTGSYYRQKFSKNIKNMCCSSPDLLLGIILGSIFRKLLRKFGAQNGVFIE